jgi:hypothetical protein
MAHKDGSFRKAKFLAENLLTLRNSLQKHRANNGVCFQPGRAR